MTKTSDLVLREKIGQMLIVGFDGKELDSSSAVIQSIEKDNIGGVILFDLDYKSQTADKNIASPGQVASLNKFLQNTTQQANLKYKRPQLPLLISVDYEGGRVNRLKKEYGFPEIESAVEVVKEGPGKANQVARTMAVTLKDAGFNLNFAPVVDVNVNPDNPVISKKDRSFSANPDEVTSFARIYASNFLQQGIQCAFKHFPGHGSANADSHQGFVDVTETWKEFELQPFQQLINTDNACGMIMTAHIVNRQLDDSGLPATLSAKILTGMLRNSLKFEGIIVSDDMQMKAISDYYGLEQALTLAINAGVDMFIFGNQLTDKPQDPAVIIDIITAQVKAGHISPEKIEAAYQRILAFKKNLQQ